MVRDRDRDRNNLPFLSFYVKVSTVFLITAKSLTLASSASMRMMGLDLHAYRPIRTSSPNGTSRLSGALAGNRRVCHHDTHDRGK
jgi:hypothetical protein